MIVVQNKYQLGQEVFLITDPDQHGRLITAIIVTYGCLQYELKAGTEVSQHLEMEISTERDMARMMFETDDDDQD